MTKSPIPHHIIAIGASAGSIEEINTFFDHTPLDGVSYVIIQHLSADFKSRMVEIIARHSKLEVLQAADGMKVICNKVYLIPNDKFMTISKGKLYLSAKGKLKGPHLTINTFFKSLAADCAKKSIAIVLSGLGSDGAEGIKSIKQGGGFVIVREPSNTEFKSMPSHAIATGCVDLIMEPRDMPKAIEHYVEKEILEITAAEEDDRDLLSILSYVKGNTDHDFTDYKKSTIMRRTKRRASFHGFSDLCSYYQFLQRTPAEAAELATEFLISVTSFFRDKESFEFIGATVIPKILGQLRSDEELKMWVAGCATGEEVYSLAMLLADHLTEAHQDLSIKIFATDIDKAALAFAGKGIYKAEALKNLSEVQIGNYFTKVDDRYKVNNKIRKMVIFAHHDLVKNPPYCNMQLISCRNLLIYMTPVLQKKILNMFLFGLKTDGFLFLGSSENPLPVLNNLEVVSKKWKIYRKIKATHHDLKFDAFSFKGVPEFGLPIPFKQQENKRSVGPALDKLMNISLSADLKYLVICVDSELNVIQSYGDTSYLLQKHFVTELSELLPKALEIAFRTLIKKVSLTRSPQSITGIQFNDASLVKQLSLTVSPLIMDGTDETFFMVLIRDSDRIGSAETELFNENVFRDEYIVSLETEVRLLKEKLNFANENLLASSENLQSFNEELISANEEMQSTNEEMQSVNEELNTINYDYQSKNRELLEINDDLNNYFRSNLNGQIFLDRELNLMKFSPGTVKQINLKESDIGRPISHITTNIKFETIIEDIKKVIEEGCVVKKEIETNDGLWYQIMTMPYLQSDNRINGAIITFNDITALKSAQDKLDMTNMLLTMATDSVRMGTWSFDFETKEFIFSSHLRDILGCEGDPNDDYECFLEHVLPDHKQNVINAVNATINEGKEFDIEFSLIKPHESSVGWVRAIGNLSKNQEGNPSYFTGLLYDTTVDKMDDIRKNDFIAMVSHELKTPITSLQAYIQIVTAKALQNQDTFTVVTLNKAFSQVKKMTGLINGFLNVSLLQSGKIQLNTSDFKMHELVEDIIAETRLTVASHTIELNVCQNSEIHGDRDKISQVVSNLVGNAIKYSPKGKNISVSCLNNHDHIQVSVRDEGKGIDPADIDKLFDRYYRIDNLNTRHISGFGLGLYLSAEIIHRHNGKIWVESEPDIGSVFHFTLPNS